MTTDQLVSFHDRGSHCVAFLGVHIVGAVSESGKWMSKLEGDGAWRASNGGDLAGAKAALSAHVREWYEAAHQRLGEGQAERLCEQLKKRQRPAAPQAIRFKEIEPQAVLARLIRDGVVTTYVLPPIVEVADGAMPPKHTLHQARMYCVSALEIAENKLRAVPGDRLAMNDWGFFAGMLSLLDCCDGDAVIKGQLKRIAQERDAAAKAAAESSDQTEAAVTGDAA